jgi:hypothetical protein
LTVIIIADIAAVAVTITCISPTGATTTLLFFESETLVECVEGVRDGYSWIAAKTILGTFSSVLVVRRAVEAHSRSEDTVRGELTGEFATVK